MWLLSRARCVSSISLGLSSISRIVLALIWSPKCEVERRAAIHLRFGPNAPAVAVNDALHGGQVDAGAWKFGRPVQALKGSEQRTGVCHIEAGAPAVLNNSIAPKARRTRRRCSLMAIGIVCPPIIERRPPTPWVSARPGTAGATTSPVNQTRALAETLRDAG